VRGFSIGLATIGSDVDDDDDETEVVAVVVDNDETILEKSLVVVVIAVAAFVEVDVEGTGGPKREGAVAALFVVEVFFLSGKTNKENSDIVLIYLFGILMFIIFFFSKEKKSILRIKNLKYFLKLKFAILFFFFSVG
jgi:hypothetical protein